MSQINETYLRGLKRTELQRLAREHKVKANLKSQVIIDVLLQRAEVKKTQVGDRIPTVQPALAPKVKTEQTLLLSPLEMTLAPAALFNSNSQTYLGDTTSLQPALAEAVNSESQGYFRDNTSQQATTAVVSGSETQTYPGDADAQSTPTIKVGNALQIHFGDSPSRPQISAAEDAQIRAALRPLYHHEDSDSEDEPEYLVVKPLDAAFFKEIVQSIALAPDSRLDVDYPGSPPDYSKREDLPAEEELVRETVQMIAEVEKDNHMMMERIVKLRAAAAEIRSRAKVVRAVVRAEDMNRVRMMTYLTYWQPIYEGWEWREIWSGKMTVRNDNDFVGVTSSDEEDMNDNDDGGDDEDRPTINGQPVPPGQARANEDAKKDNVNGQQLPNPRSDADPANAMKATECSDATVAGKKRPREDDTAGMSSISPDDLRYTPRRRTENNDAETRPKTPERESKRIKAESIQMLDNISPPPTPTPKRVTDKGKAKMTAGQVQALENERAAAEALTEIAESSPCRLRTVPQRHENGESSAQAQQVVGFANEQAVTIPIPMFRSTLNPGGPLYNAAIARQNNPVALPDNAQNNGGIPTGSLFSSASNHPRPTRWSTRKRKRED